MEYRRLGRSGVLVSPLALGTDNLANPTPRDEGIRMIHAAIDGGINLIDTSDSYAAGESERIIGEALAAERAPRRRAASRPRSTTRPGQGRTIAATRGCTSMRACDDSLRRLGVDHIDLYQLHRPDFDDADRGDARRARRSGARRQGALHRQLDRAGVARRRGA